MTRRRTKLSLLAEVQALRDAARMPLRVVTQESECELRDRTGFVPAEQYATTPVMQNEIGTFRGMRILRALEELTL